MEAETPCVDGDLPGHGREVCGAKTKSGGSCRGIAMPNGRCRRHGGATPGGVACANFKHGGHSKYLPKDVVKLFREAREDPELLSTRENAAALTARMRQLFTRIPDTPASKLWQDLRDAHTLLRAAAASGDQKKFAAALDELGPLIQQGSHEADLWDEIRGLAQEHAKLAKVEWDRLKALGQVLTAEQTTVFVHAVGLMLRENIQDRSILQRVSDGLHRLLIQRGRETVVEGELSDPVQGQEAVPETEGVV